MVCAIGARLQEKVLAMSCMRAFVVVEAATYEKSSDSKRKRVRKWKVKLSAPFLFAKMKLVRNYVFTSHTVAPHRDVGTVLPALTRHITLLSDNTIAQTTYNEAVPDY